MLRQQYNPTTCGQQILKDMLLSRTTESVSLGFTYNFCHFINVTDWLDAILGQVGHIASAAVIVQQEVKSVGHLFVLVNHAACDCACCTARCDAASDDSYSDLNSSRGFSHCMSVCLFVVCLAVDNASHSDFNKLRQFIIRYTIISIIIIIIPRQCLWCCHHGRAIARVHSVHLMNVERRSYDRNKNAKNVPKTKRDDLGCESACTGCRSLHPPSPFIIITQPESWYSFYRPTEGRRLSRSS